MRDALSRMNQLLDQLRTNLVANVDHIRATLPPHVAEWRTRVLSLRDREKRRVIRRAAWRAAWPLLVFAVAYIAAWSYLFVAAFLGDHPPPAPLFPPGAVLFSALMLAPPRRWWRFLVVAFVIQVPILAYLHLPLWWNLVGLTPDAIEPIVAAALIRRFIPLPVRFSGLREVSVYTACVAAAVLVGATIGSLVNAAGGEPYWSSWETWFLGDTLSYLVLAPTILLWIAAGAGGLRAGSRRRYTEAALLYGGLLVLGSIVFDARLLGPDTARALIYLPVPLLLWAAVRFGPRGTASALSLLVVLAIPAVADASGPFASQSSPAAATLGNIFTLQLFLLVIGVPLFFLAALVQEHSRAEEALRTSEARARAVVRNLPHSAVLLFDEDLRHSFADGPGLRVLDLTPEELEGRTVLESFPSDMAAALAPQYKAALSVRTVEVDMAYGQHIYHVQVVPMPREAAGAAARSGMVVFQDVTEQRRVRDERERERTLTAMLGALSQEFRTLAEHSPDFIARLDPSGRYLYVNQAGAELFGMPEEHWAGKAFGELGIRGTNSEPWAQALREVVETRRPRTFDAEVQASDGEMRSLHVRYIPEIAYDGTLRSVLGIAADVSALKQAEAHLTEQASEFEAIFESQADGVGVYDMHGRFVRANAALRALLGLDADADYPSLPFEERARRLRLYDEQGQTLPLAQWPQLRVLRGEILAGASAMEVGVRTLDGRDLWISITGAPLHAPDGQATGTVLIARDVTARRALEQQVRDLAHELEAVLDASPDVIAVFDQEQRIIRANRALRASVRDIDIATFATLSPQARAERLHMRDAQGRPFPVEDLPDVRALRGEVLVDRTSVDAQVRMPDGREMAANVAAAPVYDQEGRVIRAVTVWRDMSERLRLERQVAEQAAELEAIFEAMADGMLVHDAQGRVRRVNRAYRDLMGAEADPDHFARSIDERVRRLRVLDEQGHPKSEGHSVSRRVLSGEVVSEQNTEDVQMHTLDGRDLWVNTSGAPIYGPDSQITGVVLISRDVTARRALERRVAEQASELEAIFEAQTDVVVVYDQQGRFIRGNRAWEDFVHQSAEWRRLSTQPAFAALPLADQMAWLGQQIQDEHGHLIAVDDRPTARALRGETVSGSAAVDEWYQIADGRDVLLSVSAAPMRDQAGHVTGVVVVGRDVTARRQLELQLEERERQYRTLVESSPDIIARFDRNLRYLYVNPAVTQVAPIPPEQYLGKTNAELGWPESVYDPANRAIEQVFQTGQAQTLEEGDGAFSDSAIARSFRAQFLPERAPDGRVESVLTVTTDITALKRTEQALLEANARLELARQEEERRKQIAESLRGVLSVLNSNRPPQDVLQYIVRQVEELLGSAAAAIYGPDHFTESLAPGVPATALRVQASEGLRIGGRRTRPLQRLPFTDAAVEQVLASVQPVAQITQVAQVALYGQSPLGQDGDAEADKDGNDGNAAIPHLDGALPAPYQALLVVPIRVHDELYGCLLLFYKQPRRFVAEEVALAQTYADQAAQAITNARLQAQLEQEAAAAERNHLARELHDTVTQEIYSASLIAESLPKVWQTHQAEAEGGLHQLDALIRSALAGLRTLLLELRPTALEQSPLSEALRKLGAAMSTRAGVPIIVDIDGAADPEPPLPAAVKVAFYRVAQESLMNTAKYAKAHAIHVRLRIKGSRGKSRLELEVADDGRGFDPEAVLSGHFGLSIMRERARSVGASMQVRSRAGQGTVVVMRWRSDREAAALEQEAVAGGGIS